VVVFGGFHSDLVDVALWCLLVLLSGVFMVGRLIVYWVFIF